MIYRLIDNILKTGGLAIKTMPLKLFSAFAIKNWLKIFLLVLFRKRYSPANYGPFATKIFIFKKHSTFAGIIWSLKNILHLQALVAMRVVANITFWRQNSGHKSLCSSDSCLRWIMSCQKWYTFSDDFNYWQLKFYLLATKVTDPKFTGSSTIRTLDIIV